MPTTTRTVALALLLLGAACAPDHEPFVCHEDSNCSFERGGETGRCWASPARYDTCAYRDASCLSGWRWDDLEELTECVAAENVCASLEPNTCN